MINKIEFAKAIAEGRDTPEAARLRRHIERLEGGKVFDTMPADLYNYVQAVFKTKRIKSDLDSETVLFQINNVLELCGTHAELTKQYMRRILARNRAEILPALKAINIKTAA